MTDFHLGLIIGGSIGVMVTYIIMEVMMFNYKESVSDYVDKVNKYKDSSEELIRNLKQQSRILNN